MSSPPLVSVIMIFLNAERFIEEAIESVFAQTWPHWELLLVDDGSTDCSEAMAKAYAGQHPEHVRYLEHPGGTNRGMSASRNLGLAHSRGDYIAFLDADDLFLPERLTRHVAMLEALPTVGAVQGEVLFWRSWRDPDEADCVGPALPFGPGSVLEPPALLLALLDSEGSTAPGVCNFTVRRSLVATLGGFEDSFRGLYEDQVFVSKVYLAAPVGLLGECLAWYRQHHQSCTQAGRRQGAYRPGHLDPARQPYLRWLESYLVQRGVRDRRVQDALARQAWPFRHPHLSALMMLPMDLAEAATRAARAALRLALPGPVYVRLLRWRGARKYRRWQFRVARIARRAGQDAGHD
jgi:glycosyltransferase involved in cell wall biosynthesis